MFLALAILALIAVACLLSIATWPMAFGTLRGRHHDHLIPTAPRTYRRPF